MDFKWTKNIERYLFKAIDIRVQELEESYRDSARTSAEVIPEKNLLGTRTGRLGPQNGVTVDLPTNMPEAYFTAKQDQHNHSGQAHHIFSRLLNLWIFFTKFSLFCFSTVHCRRFLLRSKIPIKMFIITEKYSLQSTKKIEK